MIAGVGIENLKQTADSGREAGFESLGHLHLAQGRVSESFLSLGDWFILGSIEKTGKTIAGLDGEGHAPP